MGLLVLRHRRLHRLELRVGRSAHVLSESLLEVRAGVFRGEEFSEENFGRSKVPHLRSGTKAAGVGFMREFVGVNAIGQDFNLIRVWIRVG